MIHSHPGSRQGAPISFQGVSKSFGPVRALEDFNLNVEPGEFLTFLGPSGSGKTTALNILAGFLDATAGDILIDGVSINRLPSEKRNIGMVFQNYSLFPHMTVRENVAFPLRMRGISRSERSAAADKALAMVRLEGYGDRRPRELSGGQQQRVAFARAVAFEPRVLLMDEPLGALDLKLREAMQEEIRQIQRRIGCTVIYVTHDQSEALAMSNRIVVMSNGRIQQVGTPLDIYDRPANSFVAKFVGETNLLPAEVVNGSLSVGGQPISAPLPTHISQNWRGLITVRPEHINRGRDANAISVEGSISDVAFHGSSIRYVATCGVVGALIIHEQRRDGVDVLAIGNQVTFNFDLKHATFLDE